MLIKKWSDRNEIKKSPESAIATFLAIDDFNIADFAISNLNIIYKNLQETENKDEIEVMDINEEVNDDDTLLDGLSASILEDDIISPVQSKLK